MFKFTQSNETKYLPCPTLDGGDGKIISIKSDFSRNPSLVLEHARRDEKGEHHTPPAHPGANALEETAWWGLMIPPLPNSPPFTPVLPPILEAIPPFTSVAPPTLEATPAPSPTAEVIKSYHKHLLAAPALSTGQPVTGVSKHTLRKENKRARIAKQEAQALDQHWWKTHTGRFVLPPALRRS
jgi:hypothetical protein